MIYFLLNHYKFELRQVIEVNMNTLANDEQFDVENINTKVYTQFKTQEQIKNESKLKTEEELIKLGQQMSAQEQKEKELNEKLAHNSKIIEKYKNKNKDTIHIVDEFIKHKKYIELKELMDVLMSHEEIVSQKLEQNNKKIESLNKRIDEALEDNKDLMEDNNKLEEKEETYWKPRVVKLREKVVTNKNMIKYIHVTYIIGMIHLFIFTKYGFHGYFNVLYYILYGLYRMFMFFIFVVPNCVKIIKNPETYVSLKNYLFYVSGFILNPIIEMNVYAFNNVFHYIMKTNKLISTGIILFSLFMILLINKAMKTK